MASVSIGMCQNQQPAYAWPHRHSFFLHGGLETQLFFREETDVQNHQGGVLKERCGACFPSVLCIRAVTLHIKYLPETNKSWAAPGRGLVQKQVGLATRRGTPQSSVRGVNVLHRGAKEMGWLSATSTDCSSFADWSHVWNKYLSRAAKLTRDKQFWLEISDTVL